MVAAELQGYYGPGMANPVVGCPEVSREPDVPAYEDITAAARRPRPLPDPAQVKMGALTYARTHIAIIIIRYMRNYPVERILA